jgi:ArsR family transcriptional regulator, arsenate/arsenite/antimonite-responsive transcriptional repressor
MAVQDVYRALADPTRRQILRLLQDGDLPAGAIAEQFDMTWPSISRHLTVLASAGLVESKRNGQQIVYRLTTSVLVDIISELGTMARIGKSETQTDTSVVTGEKGARTGGRTRSNRSRRGRGYSFGVGGMGLS